MTKAAKKRASAVKTSGVVGVAKSGEVKVNWGKAVKSEFFRAEVAKMKRIRDAQHSKKKSA